MELTLAVENLLVASWEVEPELVRRSLPSSLEPALTEPGQALVSLAAFTNRDVRLGARRCPSFAQVNVRTYVQRDGASGLFLYSLRTTPGGLGGALFGVPLRPARINVRPDAVEAPGLGVRLRHRRLREAAPVPRVGAEPLGTTQTIFLLSAGLRRIRCEHEPFVWEAVELGPQPRFDPLLALGFDVGEPASTLYAERTRFRLELPAEKVA
jgi:uncharacterized protein YqjF (DUF2071 family)